MESKGTNPLIRFEDMGVSNVLLHRIRKEIGLTQPTDVQAACIPPIIRGRNCLATSRTGSGKTMAFAIPMLHCWSRDPYGIYGIVLTPTRELAHQIKDQYELLGGSNLRVSVIIGGVDMQTQTLELQKRPHFIVATPGRLSDLIATGGKSTQMLFRNVKFLVYDEADRLLDGQFDDQLKTVTNCLPVKKQTLMFSATMTEDLKLVADVLASDKPFFYNYMSEDSSKSMLDCQNLIQNYILCPPDFKDGYMMEVLRLIHENKFPEKIRSLIIFVSTCRECQVLSLLLTEMGFSNVVLHSHVDQKSRLNALVKFRSSVVQILIATDVVSRGLDIKQVDLVFNYSVPMPTDYVHRVGRSGRGGHPGFSLMLITPRDIPFLQNVEEYINAKLTEMKVDEKKVLEILTDVSATKKIADLQVEESDPFEERNRINMRKKLILEGVDPSDSEDTDDNSNDNGEENIQSIVKNIKPNNKRKESSLNKGLKITSNIKRKKITPTANSKNKRLANITKKKPSVDGAKKTQAVKRLKDSPDVGCSKMPI